MVGSARFPRVKAYRELLSNFIKFLRLAQITRTQASILQLRTGHITLGSYMHRSIRKVENCLLPGVRCLTHTLHFQMPAHLSAISANGVEKKRTVPPFPALRPKSCFERTTFLFETLNASARHSVG